MGRRYDTISFLSDYGYTDEFAGVVRAVLRDLAPHATVVDITHGIEPFDVRAGSLALARSISYLPSGIVLAVVDPGVGTSRRAVAIEVAGGDGIIVGPDNGLLAPAVAMAGGAERAVVLSDPTFHLTAIGETFAGRDVFAPVAAHLCNGVDLFELGDEIEPDLLMPGIVPLSREEAGSLVAEVLWIDRFGNCQLNVGPDEIAAWGDRIRITVGDRSAPTIRSVMVVSTFGKITTGAVGLIADSSGMLALALDRRSAADELALAPGDQVVLAPSEADDAGSPVSSPVTLRATSPHTTSAPTTG